MIIVIYSIISQIKLIIRQQQSIKAQEKSFYRLAENMAVPVTGILKKIEPEQWQTIENESSTLLGMTEDTLTAAKEAARKSQEKKTTLFQSTLDNKLGSNLFITGYLVRLSVSHRIYGTGT